MCAMLAWKCVYRRLCDVLVSSLSACRTLGTPTDDTWPGVTKLPDYKPSFPRWKAQPYSKTVPSLKTDGVELLTVSKRNFLHFGVYAFSVVLFMRLVCVSCSTRSQS